jgi:ABC-type uncharacterized transport system substrate-binding protein
VSNLARPGGNITGFSLLSLELSSKRLELLKEIVPAVRRVGVLWNKGNAPVQFDATQAADGGLLSYGPSIAENFRHTADYVDRILKGAKPADLPVQQPTTFELIVSVKSAEGDWPRGAVFTAVARRRGDRMKRREFVTLDFAP